MSDKDFVEREAFSKCFANGSLLICLSYNEKLSSRGNLRKNGNNISRKIVMPGNYSVNSVFENAAERL